MAKSTQQSAACVCCDKQDCVAVVILPAVPHNLQRVDRATQRLELVCPACSRPFSVLLTNVDYRDVTDEQLIRGFIGRQTIDS